MSPPGFIRLNAVTRGERLAVTDQVKGAISAARGWILDFKQFSNLSLCIIFQIPGEACAELGRQLGRIDLRLDRASAESLAAAPAAPELAGTLQITFLHDDPDLRREVPPIPG